MVDWKLCIDSPQKRALDLCGGSLTEGDGIIDDYCDYDGRGSGHGYINGDGSGLGYSAGWGDGHGDGHGWVNGDGWSPILW